MPDDKTLGTGKQDLVFTRVFDVPVERVWKAWTDPEQVKRWWGPDGFTCPFAKIDFHEGGISLVCKRAPKQIQGGQDMYSTWTYTKIVPLREIEYLHHFADEDGNRVDPASQGLPPEMPEEVRNLVTFKAVGDKTEISVTEYDWPVGHLMQMPKMGMEQCLDKMRVGHLRPRKGCARLVGQESARLDVQKPNGAITRDELQKALLNG